MSLTSPAPQAAQDAMPTTRGLNFDLEDRNLQFLCELVMDPATFERTRPHLTAMGEVAGGELDELAAQADKNPPTLRAFDQGGRRVAQSEAYRTRGFLGLSAMSIAPTLLGSSVLNRTFFQVAPPSSER